MKTSTIVLASVAIFASVLGALQADRFLAHRADQQPVNLMASTESIRPVEYDAASGPPDFRAAAKRVTGSIVSVDRYERVSRGFFDDEGVVSETGTGSGVIVANNGTIVTNNHVVTDRAGNVAEQVKVRLADKRTFKARVLGTDPRSDLAVIKIDAPNLTPVEIGTSSNLEVGQWVLAVGNPLGFDNTVSVGVVSSLKRDLPVGTGGLVNAIQTDAAINPGNSGGALCDANGRLIGINSAIASSTGQSVGIGFAIPVDRVKSVVADITKLGYARYAGLGVQYNPRLDNALSDPEMRGELGRLTSAESVPSNGIIVLGASGSAASAGIGQYDVIQAIGDQSIDSTFALNKALVLHKPGDKVKVKYWSKGQSKTTTVTLQEVRSGAVSQPQPR